MPITVSCPACGSRFLLGDDLYRRRVAGSLVKVKCRNCSAEIAVDATEPATMPSNEAPRKHPIPPRPKTVTVLGLGPAQPAQAAPATSSPLPLNAARTPLPMSATMTPLPRAAATVTPFSSADADSLWGDEPTIALSASKVKPPPRPGVANLASAAKEDEPELIEAEEIPVSSSDAPTLSALMISAGGEHVPHGKPAADEFLVNLSAGTDGMLGAPTIDVTTFASEVEPLSVDIDEKEFEQSPTRTPRAGTIPLFGMDAVLPATNRRATLSGGTPGTVELGEKTLHAPHSEGRSRERKFVVAPQAAAVSTAAPRSRGSRAGLWLGLAAAAIAVVGVLQMRGARWTQPLAGEAQQPGLPLATSVVNTQAAIPAEVPSPEVSEGSSAAPVASGVPVANAAPVAITGTLAPQNVTVGSKLGTSPTVAAVKRSESPDRPNNSANAVRKPSAAAEPAVEKPTAVVNPIETHNAPPPAEPGTEFDPAAARSALASAAAQASACRKDGDPSGTANLTITFAPSGRVTSAQIQGPPFSGTATGGCIASTMRRASVPAFSGDHVTVSKTIIVQ